MAPRDPTENLGQGPFSQPGGFIDMGGQSPLGWAWGNTFGKVGPLLSDARQGAAAMGILDPAPPQGDPSANIQTEHYGDAPSVNQGSWLSQLGQYQAPQMGLTLEQMAHAAGKTVPMGGTSSYSQQTVKGRPADVQYVQAANEMAKQGEKAVNLRAAGEKYGAEESSNAISDAMLELGEARQKAAEEQSAVREQIVAREQRIEGARKDLSAEKVDPGRWWSNKTVGQRIMSGIAVGLAGMAAGLGKQRAADQISSMFNREMERDIELQKYEISRKGENIKGDENSLSWLYKRLGNVKEAESALRESLTQSMGLKLQQIAMTAQSPVIKANAIQMATQLRDQFEQRRHQEVVSAFDKTVKTSGSTQQRVPLLSLIQQQMKLKADDPTAIQPLTKNTGALKEVADKARSTMSFRKGIFHFWDEWKKLGLPAGTTAFWGKEGARVQMLQKIMTDAYIKTQAGQVSGDLLKQFKTVMGERFSNNEDVKKRLMDLLHHADAEEEAVLSTYGKHYDVTPYARDAISARLKQNAKFGMVYPEFRGLSKGSH